MTDTDEELRAALLMITHKANEAAIHRDEDGVLETIIEIARAALAAAPQPAPAPADERAAMIEVIEKALPWIVPCPELLAPKIADALLAAGWTWGSDVATLARPSAPETLADRVVEDGGA